MFKLFFLYNSKFSAYKIHCTSNKFSVCDVKYIEVKTIVKYTSSKISTSRVNIFKLLVMNKLKFKVQNYN